jgi:5'-3' exonuclease
MLILDLNQTMLSTLMAQIGGHTDVEIKEDLLRHMILNVIRSLKMKFGHEYGELVIACDDRDYWRKKIFPYYKANRKKAREDSELDWKTIFESLNKIREELKEYFPYRVLHVQSAEADDIIASLVMDNPEEKILILSGDKDFAQLQKFTHVKQYDPVRKTFLEHSNPTKYLAEHIMSGDRGDGIPNFLSNDNCLVIGERQKKLGATKIAKWIDLPLNEFCDETMLRNYMRNKQLIDLSLVPQNIREDVRSQYTEQSGKKRDKLFDYFMHHKLKHLMPSIGEF